VTRTFTLAALLWLAAGPALAQHNDLEQVGLSTERTQVRALRQVDGHLSFLASDTMAGRDTGSVEADISAVYVASMFRRFGLEPAGDDGTYLQTYPLVRTRLDLAALQFDMLLNGEAIRSFVPEDEYAVRGYGASGYELDGELVFAGHGLLDTVSGVDDYADLDVEGRFVLAILGAPDGDQPTSLRTVANWRAKQTAARERGAKGLLLINPPGDERAAQRYRFTTRAMLRSQIALGGEMAEADPFPRLYLQPVVARELFAAAGMDFDVAMSAREESAGLGGFALDGVRISLAAPVAAEAFSSRNTAAMLVGSDPELSKEVIVLSAHMDHVGVDGEGNVFNGADDNASGTTALMMVAEAMASDPVPPRRSILFMAVTGEEKGLLGSEWWVAHPTIDIERVVANVNIDMVGRNAPDSIGVTPSPDHAEFNSLVSLAQELGPAAGLEVSWFAGEGEYRRRVDEYYYRSDHVNFSNAGIPVIFFFAGEHEDYHQLTDTMEKIDIQKVLRVSDLVEQVVRRSADQAEKPVRFAK
jgi:hypothetical protein